ncbi:MAG: hypothetical protein Q4B34_02330, partial [Candidatus Saccharibacteria bacterium]|nr:hypothetical protein [Candidatus Saccharibacteria bacterium]
GSKTWRGAISGWFGSMTLKFISNNKLTRNLFKNWQEEAQKAIDGNTKQVAVDLMEKGTDEVKEGGAKVLTGEEEKVEGENGEDTTKIVEKTEESGSGTFNRKNVKSEADVKTQLQKIGDSYGAKAGKVANTSCMVLNVVGGIGLLISAAENLQIIRLAMQFFEAVDKVKAGFDDGSPINVFATSLNENKKQSYNVLTNLTQGTAVDLNSFTEEGDVVGLFDTEIMPYSGSAMESNGIATLYGGVMDPDDPSVQSFNFSKSFGTVLGGLGSDMDDFKGCLLSKAGTAAASAISDGMKITSCIAGLLGAAVTWGGSAAVGCGPLVAGFAKDIAVGIIKGIVISGIISVITPIATKLLTRNLIANLGGQDFGNALKKGSGLLFGNTGLTNGLSLATEDEYLAFAVAQQEVIAENAQYERMSRDPFDATSKYTFLGTLANSLMKFSTSNSLMSTIMSGGTVISSAITSLMPTSSAVDLTEQVISVEEGYDEICPYLASIGAVGDVYCNPYTITDMSTIEMDPADVEYELERDGKSNFEDELTEDGNVIIKDNSPLAKYVVFCNNRTSAWGFADQNVVNAIEKGTVDVGNGAANTVLNSGIGAISIIGDTFDIINSKISFDNIGYISGESCVAGNMVDNAEAPNWEEAKMYQRFIEDQSLAETIGLIEESAVTAYLDKYYEENPLDQSYEGILARYSGLEKEDVIALLDVLEYGNYIANYDSTTRYAFVEKDEGDEIDMEFYENQFEQVLSTPVYALVYPELRYRNFTV